MKSVDVIVIGAGGAGLMCAAQAAARSRKVLLLDHAPKLGTKILISGGGRCNFTNTGAAPVNYLSQNPHFCKSALSRYPASKFIDLVHEHSIRYHEKKLGQLFCDRSAREIVAMLEAECKKAGVEICLNSRVEGVEKTPSSRFQVRASTGEWDCESLVVATGGLSFPKLGATGFGYDLARRFGLKVVPTEPALDGFTFAGRELEMCRELSGLSVDCEMSCGAISFRENLLFTHKGMSGPAALQASLHWRRGESVEINLLPDIDTVDELARQKHGHPRLALVDWLAQKLPRRFAESFCALNAFGNVPMQEISDKRIAEIAQTLSRWTLKPTGTVGYDKAEVTRGGVDTDELSSKTMESKKVPGLYFIGEVVDVTGWLGGYNFQWAWASGWAAGQVV